MARAFVCVDLHLSLEEPLTRFICKLALSLTLTFCVAVGLAQNANTSLRGVIKDPSGAVLPGTLISLHNNATGQSLSAKSNAGGEYQFLQVPPAKYDITVTAPGFADQNETAELLVNQPATINFTLGVQTNNVSLDVSAAAETLNTTDASLGGSEDNATIQALPSETRNVPDLLSLQPGVFFLPAPTNPALQDSRSGAVNGGRSDQGNITLDGVDDNDQVNGYAFTGVLRETQDSIEEFRVSTGGANADAGRSSGAQVSLVTKSGTNKFHGAAYEYNRPTITVANDFFNKQAEANSGEPNVPGKLIRNIFGADIGGPIHKDKLFFFGNYEGSRLAENAQVTQISPTASYQQGIIQYTASDGSTQSISATQVGALDAGCQVCNTAAYSPGPGPNPNALAYFNSMPAANGTNQGDGLNEGSYSFSSPNPQTLNTLIVRLDYVPSDKHRIFVRGNLQKDTTAGTEQFPGQGPSYALISNNKGISGGDTWSISPTMVNDLRYGYVRQGSGNSGVGSGDYVDFRFLSTATAETRNTILSSPVNNIVDNFNWTKGKHSIEIGGNWRLVDQNRSSNQNSFNGASTNPYWLTGNPPPPTSLGMPAVDGGFSNSYEVAYANLIGVVPDVTDVYNYAVSSATTGTLLGDGTSIDRHFRANEYEYFIQDSWRPRSNLTITFGLRHTLLQTPYETKGQQVAPTIDTHAWYQEREAAALKGQISEPDLQFAPSGPVYHKPGLWPKSKDNFAPRLAIAYAPDAKTSIRVGAGIYYDHYGEGLINTFDQNGSFGLSTSVTNPGGVLGYENSPRFTGRHNLPFNNGTASPTQTFPYTAPTGNFAITWGLDDHLKTPYSEAMDLSVQRELKGGFTLETAYVGRLGRHLLQSLDLAEPVDFTDTQGGGDYFTAGAQLSQLADQHGGNPAATVPTIPYFEHVFPYMANFDYPGESATQAIYSDEWAPFRYNLGETTALADLDFYCFSGTEGVPYPCPAGHQSRYWQDQFSSLYALSTIGMSYYNAGQITLRHPSSHGLQTDISYTYSHSIDMGSDSERSSEFYGSPAYVAPAQSEIINTWKPNLNRASSDFDTRHLLTVDWVYQLPVGRGRPFLGGANHLTDAVLGGWQFSGIFRATSGLPFSLTEPGWTTDWQVEAFGVATQPVKTHRHFDSNGNPQYFDNPAAINSGVPSGSIVRLPYPGEAGERNYFRGDGYLNLDSGLTKNWGLGEFGDLKFGWEVYNVTNTVRFDPYSIGSQLTGGNLGTASLLLSTPRRMQFSLRYGF
jgi:Carboxypeptidase regulatory-like domain